MPKIIEYNKNNELIFMVFNKLPTSTQRKIWDIILYVSKKHLEELKEKKPEDYEFYLKRNFRNYVLPIKIELDYLQKTLDIKTSNKKKQLLKNIASLEEISIDKINILKGGKTLEINFDEESFDEVLSQYGEDIKRWERDRIIVNPVVDFDNNFFKCYLSPNVVAYIDKNNNYTRINVLIHTFLNSTYTINLYDILIAKFKAQKEMMKKGKIPQTDLIKTEYINLENLQDMLSVERNHKARKEFKIFNRDILKPAIKEINESKVTEFEIVDVLKKKKRRKIAELAFLLKPKKIFNIPALVDEEIILTNEEELVKLRKKLKEVEKDKIIQEKDLKEIKEENNPLLELKQKILNDKNYTFTDFVKDLRRLKDVEITNVLPNAKGKILKINNLGLLELDNEEIDNMKANIIRRILFQNPELLGRFEEIDEEFEALKDKFTNKVLVFKFKGYYYAIGVKDLEKTKDDKIKITGEELLRDVKDFYSVFDKDFLNEVSPLDKLTIEKKDYYIQLNMQKELEELEEFFENNKNNFKEWLDYLEKESFDLSNELININENSKEFEEKAKKLEILDNCYHKGYELLDGNKLNSLDKKMILKKFKEWKEEKDSF